MKIKAGLTLIALSLCASMLHAETAPEQKTVLFAQVRGTINPGSASYLDSAIHRAEALQSEALVVELDTPGGLLSSVRAMAQSIDEARVPVVVYVAPAGASATSAGALLALASHRAAMAPGTNIGAAHPVDSGGKDIAGAMGEKILNDTVAFAKSLAELRGRNVGLAEKVVSKSQSFTADEAKKNDLVEIIASSRAELMHKMDGHAIDFKKGGTRVIRSDGAQIVDFEMSLGQKLLNFFANPNVATLLMSLGMICVYLELSSPGAVVPGTVGAIALIVAFMSFQMLPIRSGGLLLLVLGVGLLLAEPFVIAHGAMALSGTAAFVMGLLWVMDPNQTDLRVSPLIWIPATIVMAIGAGAIAYFAAKSRKQSARAREEIGGGAQAGLAGYRGTVERIEEDAKHGIIKIRGESWDFECALAVKVGDWVQVESVKGLRVTVKKV